jgi:membrane protease YdiL (CAAX protease family)
MSENLMTAPPKPWGIIATALWTLLTLFISVIVLIPTLALWTVGRPSQDLMTYGSFLSVGLLVSTAVHVEVLALAAQRRGWQAADYLGWIIPKPRDVAITLGVIVALSLAFAALDYLLDIDVSPFMIDTYRSAREAGGLVMLWIAVVVAAPLSEEIIFRGFLYRGWAGSPRAVLPAVVVISALWAIIHVQYNWFSILQIFLFGLVLGWARWRSGSTMLTFAMHAFNNTWSMVETHWLA